MAPTIHYGWIAHFEATGRRFWSGDTEITVSGETYEAGHGIRIEGIADERGAPSGRAKASFSVTDRALRLQLLNDLGPALFTMGYVASFDRGLTWHELPKRLRGRLSTARLVDGVYEVELEKQTTISDLAVPAKWSHEEQMARTNGADRGLEYVRSLAVGNRQLRWPP